MSSLIHEKRQAKRNGEDMAQARQPAQAPQQVSNSEMLRMSGAGPLTRMSPALREKFEPGFSADFSNIRISRGYIPEEMGVQAVARGTDILLDQSAGMDVLGHELAHVVQQATGRVQKGGYPVVENAALEQEADVQGARVAAGGSVEAGMGGIGGEALSIAPMSSATAPAQCKSREEKRAEKAARRAQAQPVPPTPLAAPKTDITQSPGQMTFGGPNQRGLKASGEGHSVFRMDAGEGGSAILKAGSNPHTEAALARFYNVAGETFTRSGRQGASGWSFDAPAARALMPEERAQARAMMEGGQLSSQTLGGANFSAATLAEQEAALDDTTVFATATGRSRVDPGTRAAREPGALSDNPSDNPTEIADYRRMIGYTSALDLAMGNGDRTFASLNPENWMEDRGSRQLHLIDNVHNDGRALAQGRASRTEWLQQLLDQTRSEDGSTNSMAHLGRRMHQNAERSVDPTGTQIFDAEETGRGAQQALEDMPEMRAELGLRFRQENGGGQLTEIQQEILDRMKIMTEVMNGDHQIQGIYRELSQIGLDPQENESPAIAARRTELNGLLEGRRQAAAYGGQTHGPGPLPTAPAPRRKGLRGFLSRLRG